MWRWCDRKGRSTPIWRWTIPTKAFVAVPDFYETARTGLHYLIPVIVLIWCLMVEEMSPGLAAFWGVVAMASVVLTQRPLTAFFRNETNFARNGRSAGSEFLGGLEMGGRNMTAVGIATATAGILVGMVTLTGIGLVMTEIVEFLSGGSIVIMLILVGAICIILGSGLPTTASYVVVATLMAPVVVEIAAENDLAVPLIAVHMFVFYFGLMADVSPPVGLAAYAAAAIANADPMKVGWQGTWYELRTLLLPFIFIFSPEILMIDIGGPVHFVVVVATATFAMMAFVAALQGFFFARNRWWETAVLLLVCFTLFRPHFWMDMVAPPFRTVPGADIVKVIDATPVGRLAALQGRDHGHFRRSDQQDGAPEAGRGERRARASCRNRHHARVAEPADDLLGASGLGGGAAEAASRRQGGDRSACRTSGRTRSCSRSRR